MQHQTVVARTHRIYRISTFGSQLMYLSRSVRNNRNSGVISAKLLWTWRAIRPLLSGSSVVGSRSGRPCVQPQSQTDLRRPLAAHSPALSEKDVRTAGNHITPMLDHNTYRSVKWQFCPCVGLRYN